MEFVGSLTVGLTENCPFTGVDIILWDGKLLLVPRNDGLSLFFFRWEKEIKPSPFNSSLLESSRVVVLSILSFFLFRSISPFRCGHSTNTVERPYHHKPTTTSFQHIFTLTQRYKYQGRSFKIPVLLSPTFVSQAHFRVHSLSFRLSVWLHF